MLKRVNDGHPITFKLTTEKPGIAPTNPCPPENRMAFHTSLYLLWLHITLFQFVISKELLDSGLIADLDRFVSALKNSAVHFIETNYSNAKFKFDKFDVMGRPGRCKFLVARYNLVGCNDLSLFYDLFLKRFCKMIGASSYHVDRSKIYAGKYWLVKFDGKPGIYVPTYYLENNFHISYFSIDDLFNKNRRVYDSTFRKENDDDEKLEICDYAWLRSVTHPPKEVKLVGNVNFQLSL